MQYRVIRPCWWQERLWAEGETADIHPAEAPPRHFVPVYEEDPAPAPAMTSGVYTAVATAPDSRAKAKKTGRPRRPDSPKRPNRSNPKGA